MLDRVDRILVAVRDRAAAADTFRALLGAEKVREDDVPCYAAKRVVVRAGISEFDLMEPAGPGALADHLEARGEGIFGAGFSTPDLAGVSRRLDDAGLHFSEEGSDVFVEPDQTLGMRTALRATDDAREPTGHISYLYEITHIVDDHERASEFYANIFGLDQSRFAPIHSEMYGYGGTLTLFDPPDRLDRIELTQITEPARAMGRFYARRGPSLYMCFVETPDVTPIRERLDASGGRYEPTGDFPGAGLFIHPSALHGVLMGVSLTNVAWRWSGRPELAPKRPATA
ncbi:MAG: VOC family protein [Dehalococcoidia bacterium]